MSKIINLTPEMINEMTAEFMQSLVSSKVADGKITYTKSFQGTGAKASVYFSPIAYAKMIAIIKEFSSEVAWHGVAYRGDNPEKNEYFITDIIVYPQEVTGATVNTDQAAYEQWLYGLDDDTFNNLRFQGHSHVNMGVTPSGVDITHQEKILEQLGDNDFYIFMIWNKSFNCFCKIYDIQKNTLFETGDCTVGLMQEGTDLDAFIAGAKEMVKQKTATSWPKQTSATSTTTTTPWTVNRVPAKTTPVTTSKPAAPVNSSAKKSNKFDDEAYFGWYSKEDFADPFYYSGY